MCLPNSMCSLAFKPDSRALNEQKTQQKPCLKSSRRMLGTGIMFKEIRLFFLMLYWKDKSYLKRFRRDRVKSWTKINKVICNFLHYRRHGVYCYMYWQCPRIGAGKAAGFTWVRIKQQFSAVVLWCLNFFSHLVEYGDELDAQSLFQYPGLQWGNKTRDGSREYSWEWLPGKWGWNWVRTN